MKITLELVERSVSFINALGEREIDLRGNKLVAIENLAITKDQHDVLDFTNNDFKRLENFPPMPRLSTLLLSNNKIQYIEPDLAENLSNLKSLILSNNQIQELGDLEGLFHLKKLKYLSLLDNPVTQREHYRLFCIYQMPQLKILDFQHIKDQERRRAEALFSGDTGNQLKIQLTNTKSGTFDVGQVVEEEPTLTPQQIQAIQEAIKKAKSLDEINRLERQLRTGKIQLSQTFHDAPYHRWSIQHAEKDISQLENSIKSLQKSLKPVLELQSELKTKQEIFVRELQNFTETLNEEPVIKSSLDKFSQTLLDVEKSRELMLDQLKQLFMEPCDQFKKQVSQAKEYRKQFERSTDQFDSSLDKYLSRKQKDGPLLVDAAEELANSRKDFHQKSLDYALVLNEFQNDKKVDLIDYLLAVHYTIFTYFHQGYDLMKDLEPQMRIMSEKLNDTRKVNQDLLKKEQLEKKEILNQYASFYHPFLNASGSPPIQVPPLAANPLSQIFQNCTFQGYLLKKSSSNLRTTWLRRYFFIKENHLSYVSRDDQWQNTLLQKEKDKSGTQVIPPPDEVQMEEKEQQEQSSGVSITVAADLRLCMVRVGDGQEYVGDKALAESRRYCFELVSPAKSYVLQAENEQMLQTWVQAIQNAISQALQSPSTSYLPTPEVEKSESLRGAALELTKPLLELPDNQVCADCGRPNPEWCSISLTCLLCIECSGIHRSLGVHISKVRSLGLDDWTAELVEQMKMIDGNKGVNWIFEAQLNEPKPAPLAQRAEREKFISRKYVAKEFIRPLPENGKLQMEFEQEFLKQKDLELSFNQKFLWIFFQQPNWILSTPIASLQGANFFVGCIQKGWLPMILFLLHWKTVDTGPEQEDGLYDNERNGPLHHALASSTPLKSQIVKLLLKRGCRLDIPNKDHKTPIDLALAQDQPDPDLIMIMRMQQFEIEEKKPAKRVGPAGSVSLPTAEPEKQKEPTQTTTDKKISPTKKFFTDNNTGQTLANATANAFHLASNAASNYANRFMKKSSQQSTSSAGSTKMNQTTVVFSEDEDAGKPSIESVSNQEISSTD